jgi:hypothetical protein
MRELPILFNGDMVRAILDGRKTQTRRPVKNTVRSKSDGCKRRLFVSDEEIAEANEHLKAKHKSPLKRIDSPYQIGDLLYVRERCRCHKCFLDSDAVAWWQYEFEADGKIANWIVLPDRMKFKPGIGHCIPNGCFKELARIWLKVTDVRVERIRDISLADIEAEGVQYANEQGRGHLREKWALLWESCYGKSWERNDWCWVYTFERIEK